MKKGSFMAMTLMLAVLFVFVAGDARALNPQPEVPSKGQGKTQPKALNPQPEVPSKTKKKKKQKKQTGDKEKSPKSSTQ